MKKFFIILFVLPLLASVFSCEREIVIDLPDFESRLVVEGTVSSQPGPYTIRLTRTSPYLDTNANPPESGASVVIWDDAGNRDTLTESSPGNYVTSTLQGVIGRTYFLEVISGPDTLNASSPMMRVNPIDSLSATYYPEPRFFFDPGWYVTFHAQEAVGVGDFYRFKFFKNDSLYDGVGDLFFSDDKVVDGAYAEFEFPYTLESGDTCTIEIMSLTNTAYDYYLTLQQLITSAGNPFGAPPDNVVTNVTGDGFGFFLVSGVERKTVVVP